MSSKPTVFVIADHMHADSLGEFIAQQAAGGAVRRLKRTALFWMA